MPIYTGMVLYLEELFQTLRFPCHDQSDHDTGGFDVQEWECNVDYSMSQFVQLNLSLKKLGYESCAAAVYALCPLLHCFCFSYVHIGCTQVCRNSSCARVAELKAAPSDLIETREHRGFELVSSR